MSVVGGVKGTKNTRLSLDVPPWIFNVYQRRCFVCVRWGAIKELKTAALVFNVPLPIR